MRFIGQSKSFSYTASLIWLLQKGHFDEVIDYKSENIEKRLGELCPKGVDVFYDNVGGATLDAVLLHLGQGARIVLCGQIPV